MSTSSTTTAVTLKSLARRVRPRVRTTSRSTRQLEVVDGGEQPLHVGGLVAQGRLGQLDVPLLHRRPQDDLPADPDGGRLGPGRQRRHLDLEVAVRLREAGEPPARAQLVAGERAHVELLTPAPSRPGSAPCTSCTCRGRRRWSRRRCRSSSRRRRPSRPAAPGTPRRPAGTAAGPGRCRRSARRRTARRGGTVGTGGPGRRSAPRGGSAPGWPPAGRPARVGTSRGGGRPCSALRLPPRPEPARGGTRRSRRRPTGPCRAAGRRPAPTRRSAACARPSPRWSARATRRPAGRSR